MQLLLLLLLWRRWRPGEGVSGCQWFAQWAAGMRSWAAAPSAEARVAAAVAIQRVWRGWWSRRVLVDGVELSFNAICAELDGELLSRRPWAWPIVASSATRVIQRAVAAEASQHFPQRGHSGDAEGTEKGHSGATAGTLLGGGKGAHTAAPLNDMAMPPHDGSLVSAVVPPAICLFCGRCCARTSQYAGCGRVCARAHWLCSRCRLVTRS